MHQAALVTLFSALFALFCTASCAYAHHSFSFWGPPSPGETLAGPNLPSSSSTQTTSTSLGPGPPIRPTSSTRSSTSGTTAASSTPSTGSSPTFAGGIAQGFNYDESVDFATEFNTAKNLVGTSGFTSARLYTMIEPGTSNKPISAIPAAIDTGTTLLLGLYCSKGDANFTLETQALATAISQYGAPFTDLIVGISVGSEDLYRHSVTTDGVGDTPANINKYIAQTRQVLADAKLTKPVGHVDTYGVWTQPALGGSTVLPNVDFVGVDAYPYWQNSTPADALSTFKTAISQTKAAVGSKPVWVTETGWPVNGTAEGPAVPSIANAQAYWQSVGCSLFGQVNTWYYTLNDAGLTNGGPSFGITSTPSDTNPLFSLSCNG